jgi:hypothetical protein
LEQEGIIYHPKALKRQKDFVGVAAKRHVSKDPGRILSPNSQIESPKKKLTENKKEQEKSVFLLPFALVFLLRTT